VHIIISAYYFSATSQLGNTISKLYLSNLSMITTAQLLQMLCHSLLAFGKTPQAADQRKGRTLPGETDETKHWSNSELQRVVLLEQLAYYRTKTANLKQQAEEAAWLYYAQTSSAQTEHEQ
jgi:hypothetical protein